VSVTSVALAFLLIACGASGELSGSGNVYTNQPQGYSVEAPNAWSVLNDRGSTRFVLPGVKTSITIRSAPRNGAGDDELVSDTMRTLQALPRARISDRTRFEGAAMPGESFTLTYRPNGATVTYQRTHIVLLGRKHVFHVIYIAPDNTPVDRQGLRDMVTTLREEA
jgi:hypothetical protein